MKRKKILAVLTGLSILCCTSGSTIYAMSETHVTNNFSTGIVDIGLAEYEIVNGNEIPYVNNKVILPAMSISKIPRVHNYGNECYIRAKITFEGTDHVDEGDLYGFGTDWMRAEDGYYYYKNVLLTGEETDIFEGLQIPEDYPDAEKGFSLKIDVDAIQSKNFTPQYDNRQPWGIVEIEKCKKEGQYDISTFKQSDTQSLTVKYEGDSKKLFTDPDDFFQNIPFLMPGDVYKDTATLKNTGNKDIKLYFRSEAKDKSDLLDKISLKITAVIDNQETVFYDGNLRAASISQNKLLGIIKKGSSGDFKFEIEIPSELKNDYTILNSYVKWYFSAEEIEVSKEPTNPATTPSPSGSNSNPSSSKGSTSSGSSYNPSSSKGSTSTAIEKSVSKGTSAVAKNAKTYDMSNIGITLFALGSSMAVAVVVIQYGENKRRRKKI